MSGLEFWVQKDRKKHGVYLRSPLSAGKPRSQTERLLSDLIVRFFIGGLVVSAFSLISDLFKPKTFAGLFGAAPSIALATLGLTVLKQGKEYAATEAHAMVLGGIALLVYAITLSYLLLRFRFSTLPVALTGLILWLAVATGLWYVMFT